MVSYTRIQRLWLALSKASNRVGISLPTHEDGKTSSFRNVVFSSYLDLRMMDKVHKPTDYYNSSALSPDPKIQNLVIMTIHMLYHLILLAQLT
jgi:hypothetical protein